LQKAPGDTFDAVHRPSAEYASQVPQRIAENIVAYIRLAMSQNATMADVLVEQKIPSSLTSASRAKRNPSGYRTQTEVATRIGNEQRGQKGAAPKQLDFAPLIKRSASSLRRRCLQHLAPSLHSPPEEFYRGYVLGYMIGSAS
jgi:hypothetical protein